MWEDLCSSRGFCCCCCWLFVWITTCWNYPNLKGLSIHKEPLPNLPTLNAAAKGIAKASTQSRRYSKVTFPTSEETEFSLLNWRTSVPTTINIVHCSSGYFYFDWYRWKDNADRCSRNEEQATILFVFMSWKFILPFVQPTPELNAWTHSSYQLYT